MQLKKTEYAIHPSGDVYCLGYDDEGVYLYRIKNVWDPKGRDEWYKNERLEAQKKIQAAIVNDTNVRVRSEPNLNGKQIGIIQKGDRVTIIEQGTVTMKIDTMEACWYRIKTEKGLEGWTYGAFLDIQK